MTTVVVLSALVVPLERGSLPGILEKAISELPDAIVTGPANGVRARKLNSPSVVAHTELLESIFESHGARAGRLVGHKAASLELGCDLLPGDAELAEVFAHNELETSSRESKGASVWGRNAAHVVAPQGFSLT